VQGDTLNLRKVVFDSDTASDDAIAMILAHKKFDVVGVTIVAGNVRFENQVKNALFTLEYFGFDTPVYLGSRRPILGHWRTVEEVHGENGMGGWAYPEPTRKAEAEYAPDALIRLSKEYEGELEILAVSPLTNLALAYLKDENITKRIKKVWIMGGAFTQGNMGMSSEFNFWVDPEATHIVLHAGFDITLVPWEVAVEAATITDTEWHALLSRGKKADLFFVNACKVLHEYSKSKGMRGSVQPDSLTVAIAEERTLILEAKRVYVDVETCGLSRGAMLVDHYFLTKNQENVELVFRADEKKFKAMFFETLGDFS
jgi:Inosine-uridine nucleoside N-ribohydrolase